MTTKDEHRRSTLRVVDLNIGNAKMMLLTRTNSAKRFKKFFFEVLVFMFDTFESVSNETNGIDFSIQVHDIILDGA